ncbi:MAG: hypothetical protein KBD25_03200 [Rickettsiaceae bacterium]|nr:hypothetical protein [Rickettsiaceae bacterium]
MQNILRLPLCQGASLKSEKHKKINNSVNHGKIKLRSHDNYESTMPSLEEISVAKAKEALKRGLFGTKEAMQLFSNLEAAREANAIFKQRSVQALPANITETPKFHEVKIGSQDLPESAKETFARISLRARETFIEEQIERASLYNIPYKSYGNDYYRLMVDIDHYEYLLEKAKDYCVDWDMSEYDPVALEQELEEAEHNAYLYNQELRSYFSLTRGVEV